MAYVTVLKSFTTEWTEITNKIAMLQFNSVCYMHLGGQTPPDEDAVGFLMPRNEIYINGSDEVTIWVKLLSEGTKDNTIVLVEKVS